MENNNDVTDTLRVVSPEGRRFKMLTDAAHVAYYESNYEKYSADLVLKHCRDRGTFIDVGAHHGYYTLLVATSRKQCRILAFEPVPDNLRILNENLKLNNISNTTVFDSAVSDRDGIRYFKVRDFSSHGSLYKDHISQMVKRIKVTTISLDHLLTNTLTQPVVIKIDVEGHELNVLRGMISLLANTDDLTLLLEFNPLMLTKANQRPEDILQLIASLDFDIYCIDDQSGLMYRFETDHLNEWETYLDEDNFRKGYFNVLCLKKDKSLSVCVFSHSSQVNSAGRGLLELTAQLTQDYGAICSVVLPTDGPLKTGLEEAGTSTLVLDYSWWCDFGAVSEEQAMERRKVGVESLAMYLPALSKINPHVVVTDTMVIPWGAVAATLLGKPHVWCIRESGEFDEKLTFDMPFPKVAEIIRDSSNIVVTDSDAIRPWLSGATLGTGVYYTLAQDGLTKDQYGNKMHDLLSRVQKEQNPLSRACLDYSLDVIRLLLVTKRADNAQLDSTRAELTTARQEIDSMRAQLAAAQQEIDSMRAKLAEAQQECTRCVYSLRQPGKR